MGASHNYRHSRVGGNPAGGANGDAWSTWSCDSTDIELCKEPLVGEGWGEGDRSGQGAGPANKNLPIRHNTPLSNPSHHSPSISMLFRTNLTKPLDITNIRAILGIRVTPRYIAALTSVAPQPRQLAGRSVGT